MWILHVLLDMSRAAAWRPLQPSYQVVVRKYMAVLLRKIETRSLLETELAVLEFSQWWSIAQQ